ncbi:MAG: NAD(P)-binding protein, partial [Deltaproteobacteria bacterium]|nr:NAD(P)-binding protein [Deltaproteobacteria bacterium]
MQKIIILGAGPAGIALGMKLISRPDLHAEIVIIEKESYVGGMASSFEYKGLYFDYGSHRLHRMTAPEILHDIRSLLGPDLLDRPRNGRIRLLGRFVRFPLKPLDFAMHLPPSFLGGIARDMVTKPFRREEKDRHSFANVLLKGLGETICKTFYFPYARKLWGMPPEKIGAIQAHRRISAKSMGKIIRKALGVIPGLKAICGGH